MQHHPKIICITGHTATGKTTVIQKLVRDYKYHLVQGNTLVKSHTPVDKIKQNIENLSKLNTPKILIDGFPQTVQDGIFFQSNFHPIQMMLNFDSSEENIFKRKKSLDSKLTIQQIRDNLSKEKQTLGPVIQYYQQFGVVDHINTDPHEDEVYEKVKKVLLPKTIFLYGPPKTGKTTVGEILAQKLGYEFISLRTFYSFREKKRISFDILNQLIELIKNSHHNKFVIDDVFNTAQEYKIFTEHLGQPSKLFQFQLSKDQVEKSMSQHVSNQQDKKDAKSRYIKFIDNRSPFLTLVKNKPYHIKISAANHIEQICRQIIQYLKPIVLASVYQNKQQQEFLQNLQTKKGWRILDIQNLFNGHIQRKTAIGLKLATFKPGTVPIKGYLACFKNSLFGQAQNKFILKKLGDFFEIYQLFQKQFLFQIKLLSIQFQPRHYFIEKNHAIMYFYERGDVVQIKEKHLDLVEGSLNRNVKYGILFGAPGSGKSTLSKLISKNYNFIQIDWQAILNIVKQKYLTQQQKGLQEVPFPKVIKYFKDQFALNPTKTFLFDGFPYEKHLDKFIQQLGVPTYFLNLKIQKQALVRRTRIKNQADVNAQLGQQQSQKIDANLQKGVSLLKISQDIATNHVISKSYSIQSSGSIQATIKLFQPIFGRRVFLVNEQIQDNSVIQDTFHILFKNMSYNNELIFVDIQSLLVKYYHADNKFSRQLQNQYKMRTIQQASPYNTKNYTPNLMIQIINQYLQQTNQTKRDILLINYPTHDPNYFFPRASDQFSAIQNGIGKVRLLCYIQRNDADFTINDPILKLQKPIVQVKEKKQGQQGEQKAPQEDQKKKPAFNIYDYTWTNSNGNPKDLCQWYFASKSRVEKSKLTMTNYQDQMLFDQFDGYISRVRSDPNSNIFIEVKRLF